MRSRINVISNGRLGIGIIMYTIADAASLLRALFEKSKPFYSKRPDRNQKRAHDKFITWCTDMTYHEGATVPVQSCASIWKKILVDGANTGFDTTAYIRDCKDEDEFKAVINELLRMTRSYFLKSNWGVDFPFGFLEYYEVDDNVPNMAKEPDYFKYCHPESDVWLDCKAEMLWDDTPDNENVACGHMWVRVDCTDNKDVPGYIAEVAEESNGLKVDWYAPHWTSIQRYLCLKASGSADLQKKFGTKTATTMNTLDDAIVQRYVNIIRQMYMCHLLDKATKDDGEIRGYKNNMARQMAKYIETEADYKDLVVPLQCKGDIGLVVSRAAINATDFINVGEFIAVS